MIIFPFLFSPLLCLPLSTVHAVLAYGLGAILVLLFNASGAHCKQPRPVHPPCRKVLRRALPLCVWCWKCDCGRQNLPAAGLQSALWVSGLIWDGGCVGAVCWKSVEQWLSDTVSVFMTNKEISDFSCSLCPAEPRKFCKNVALSSLTCDLGIRNPASEFYFPMTSVIECDWQKRKIKASEFTPENNVGQLLSNLRVPQLALKSKNDPAASNQTT